jgi:hypothetical protein
MSKRQNHLKPSEAETLMFGYILSSIAVAIVFAFFLAAFAFALAPMIAKKLERMVSVATRS